MRKILELKENEIQNLKLENLNFKKQLKESEDFLNKINNEIIFNKNN